MNINDYTYHICDRFVLLFIAFVGLVGTSYILVSGNLNSSPSYLNGFSNEINMTFQNNAINHGVKSTKAESQSSLVMPASYKMNTLEAGTYEITSEEIGEQ